ncbi:hypothetical protein B296_00045974, partial [Ensete ventricosum]
SSRSLVQARGRVALPGARSGLLDPPQGPEVGGGSVAPAAGASGPRARHRERGAPLQSPHHRPRRHRHRHARYQQEEAKKRPYPRPAHHWPANRCDGRSPPSRCHLYAVRGSPMENQWVFYLMGCTLLGMGCGGTHPSGLHTSI